MKEIKTISAAEARQRFAEITDEVRTKRVSYSVIRHGKEVARIVAPASENNNDLDSNFVEAVKGTIKKFDSALNELANI